jgi:hypothetical protein
VEYVPAARSSKNRDVGVLEPKLQNCTKDTYRRMLIDKVLPSIVANWPKGRANEGAIFI